MSTLRERRPGAARVAADAALTGLVTLVIALGVATGTAVAAGQTVRAGSTALGGDEHRAPCSSTAIACVQLSTQHVWLVRDGRVVRDGFISTGATDTETPTGMFQVQWKSKNHVSGRYGTPMPYSVFFDGRGDALHEGSLAVQSRGCVHLTREDAKAFYDALRPGDPVQILP